MAKRKFKHHLIYYPARALMALLGVLPAFLVARLGRAFGALVFTLAGGERRRTLANIRKAFPRGFDDRQVERLARTVWVRLGWNLFETVSWLRWPNERIAAQVARTRGQDNIEKALAGGKGALVVTAHLGNWELLAAHLGSKHPVSAVAQNLYDPRFDRIVTRFREANLRVAMIKRGFALRGILEALKGGRLVIALVDHDTGKDGIFVPFFGIPSWTQTGVARIARRTGAPILPAFVVRGSDGKYEFHVEKAFSVPRAGDGERDVEDAVRRYTGVVESYVKAYPDQWMWMHERWRTRPPGE